MGEFLGVNIYANMVSLYKTAIRLLKTMLPLPSAASPYQHCCNFPLQQFIHKTYRQTDWGDLTSNIATERSANFLIRVAANRMGASTHPKVVSLDRGPEMGKRGRCCRANF